MRLGALVGLAIKKLSIQAANAGSKFQTGNNRPGCNGPSFWFETTALEMPAGFDRFTIAPILHAMGGRTRTYGQAM